MLERILVPLDGSTHAEAILTELRVLLARHDSEVILLRVVLPPTTIKPPAYARLLDERRAEARAYIQRVVGELASLFGAEILLVHVLDENLAGELPMPDIERTQEIVTAAGLRAEAVFERGDAAGRILAVAAERQANLIIMATHGRSGLKRWVLGSVAERVMRAAPVPLLLVRGREAEPR